MLHYGDPDWYEKWVSPDRAWFRKDEIKQVRLLPSLVSSASAFEGK
jgi:hypothetical protein